MKQEQNIETICFIRQYMRYTFVAYLFGAGHCSRDAIFAPSMGPATIGETKIPYGHGASIWAPFGSIWAPFGSMKVGPIVANMAPKWHVEGPLEPLLRASWCFQGFKGAFLAHFGASGHGFRAIAWSFGRSWGQYMAKGWNVYLCTLYILCIINLPSCIQKT